MGYSLSAYERETTITFNEAETEATVYSASPKWIRKLDRLCSENPGQFQCTGEDHAVGGDLTGKFYRVDKSLVSIRPRTRHRELSEAQRQELVERMQKAREQRAQVAKGA